MVIPLHSVLVDPQDASQPLNISRLLILHEVSNEQALTLALHIAVMALG